MTIEEERTRCDDRLALTRAEAYATVKVWRDAGVKRRARHCKSCGRWHVWPR